MNTDSVAQKSGFLRTLSGHRSVVPASHRKKPMTALPHPCLSGSIRGSNCIVPAQSLATSQARLRHRGLQVGAASRFRAACSTLQKTVNLRRCETKFSVAFASPARRVRLVYRFLENGGRERESGAVARALQDLAEVGRRVVRAKRRGVWNASSALAQTQALSPNLKHFVSHPLGGNLAISDCATAPSG
jgi:hypothetical protein